MPSSYSTTSISTSPQALKKLKLVRWQLVQLVVHYAYVICPSDMRVGPAL
jgi:hypothetical protein